MRKITINIPTTCSGGDEEDCPFMKPNYSTLGWWCDIYKKKLKTYEITTTKNEKKIIKNYVLPCTECIGENK